MKYRSIRKCVFGKELLPSTLIAVFAATATALHAVSFAESNDDDMEIVTVVARNTKESLQDVPVAVTTISDDVMNAYRIDEATDLISMVPALNVSVGGSGAGAQITLRGVGSSFISNAFDSAVALNYDGISVSTQRFRQSAFFDV